MDNYTWLLSDMKHASKVHWWVLQNLTALLEITKNFKGNNVISNIFSQRISMYFWLGFTRAIKTIQYSIGTELLFLLLYWLHPHMNFCDTFCEIHPCNSPREMPLEYLQTYVHIFFNSKYGSHYIYLTHKCIYIDASLACHKHRFQSSTWARPRVWSFTCSLNHTYAHWVFFLISTYVCIWEELSG